MRHLRRLALFFVLAASFALTSAPLVAAAQGNASLSGFVFIDRDLNGLFDAGEYYLPDTELMLMHGRDEAATQVGSVTTGQDGHYLFSGLAAGDYYIQVLLQGDYVFAPFQAGGSAAIPAAARSSRTTVFTLNEGEQSQDKVLIGAIDETDASFLRVIAFGDSNANGGRFSNEPLLRNVQLEVQFEMDGQYYTVASAKTDKEGLATIDQVPPGIYVLAATLPSPYIIGPLGVKINPFYNVVLPSGSSFGRSAPFRLSVKGSLGLGVGGVKTGAAQGRVWQDSNFNGNQEADEPGVAGVVLNLQHQTMAISHQTTSDAQGNYSFTSLNAGSYKLSTTLSDQQMFTISGGSSLFSLDDSRSASAQITVSVEQTLPIKPIGVIPNTSLAVLAFHDSNVNGQLDAEELPFAGAQLEVLKEDRLVTSSNTNKAGEALIPMLRGGEMQLRLTLPDGQIFSVAGGEGGNAFFSEKASSSLTIPYTLVPGTRGELHAAVTLPALLAGNLYEDQNSSGTYDVGETMMPGFTVQALNAAGVIVGETQTDAQGHYQLPALIPGTYTTRIMLISPYIFSSAPGGSAAMVNKITSQTAEYGQAEPVTLAAGQTLDNMDGAIFRSGVVQGDVLLGDEQDQFAGQQGGLEGVFVELLDKDGVPVSEYTGATTNAEGHFLLKGALPGTYALRYTLPQDAAFSQPLTDTMTHVSEPFPINASEELQAVPLFAVKTGTYSGIVYLDVNVDGSMDQSDTPIGGARVQLVSATAANSRETLSGGDGNYVLRGLRPGKYTLILTLPEGKLISYDEASPLSPATSNTSQVELEITMGLISSGNMIAAVNAHKLMGTIYFDNNLDGALQPNEPGLGLELKLRHVLSGVQFTATSDASGLYEVPLLYPGAYQLSAALAEDFELFAPAGATNTGLTWELPLALSSGGAATKQDIGLVQFGSLAGALWDMGGGQTDIEGLQVRLLKAASNEQVSEATTDSQGAYRFDRLYPGEYSVQVTLKAGFRFAREIDSQMTRFSLITSDGSIVNKEAGRSLPFTLAMNEDKTAQDIGLGAMGKMGDFAWLDLDQDGMQDADEPGVPGIQIKLYQHGQIAAQTQTDAYGRYLFSELYPGSYSVEVTMPPELKATRHQTEFRLVASILPQVAGTTVITDGISVPSGGRNLNCDVGFALVQEGILPTSMQNLPQKDWTPLVPTVPRRMR